MTGEHEIELLTAFVTGDHTAAYRVRNMPQAAGIEAGVCQLQMG